MRLFSTDIDGTVYDGPESARRFASFWASQSPRPLLAYNTGRSADDAFALIGAAALPAPDYLITGVGTVIHRVMDGEELVGWSNHLADGWDRALVDETVAALSPARPQPSDCQGPHKSSWFWEAADLSLVAEILERMAGMGMRAQAVYSSGRDLDFLPHRANKGNAVAWLGREIGLANADIIVAGDSGNDASMYEVEGVRGIVVANAESSLAASVCRIRHFHASKSCAEGVIEGLEHFFGIANQTEKSPPP